MTDIITADYIKTNYARLSGWLGAARMLSKKTSGLDASLWLLAHHLNNQGSLDENLTYKAWCKRTSTPKLNTRIFGRDPCIFEIMREPVFQTLLEHNIIAGFSNMFSTAFLRMSNPITEEKIIAVYDISNTLKFQTPNRNNLIIKSKTTDDIVWITESLNKIDSNDPYGFFIAMLDKPASTFSNNCFNREEALDIVNFLELDRDLLIKRYLRYTLHYKVRETFYQKPDFDTNLNRCIHNAKQFLSMYYTDTKIEASFLLYELHNDVKQVLCNLGIDNMNIEVTTELPELLNTFSGLE